MDTIQLTTELVSRLGKMLRPKTWPERFAALVEMHDQLIDDIEDYGVFCDIFPKVIEGVVKELGGGKIASLEQAQIYSNSANPGHRDSAGTWIAQHYRANRSPEPATVGYA
jgi:hypothetical protein